MSFIERLLKKPKNARSHYTLYNFSLFVCLTGMTASANLRLRGTFARLQMAAVNKKHDPNFTAFSAIQRQRQQDENRNQNKHVLLFSGPPN